MRGSGPNLPFANPVFKIGKGKQVWWGPIWETLNANDILSEIEKDTLTTLLLSNAEVQKYENVSIAIVISKCSNKEARKNEKRKAKVVKAEARKRKTLKVPGKKVSSKRSKNSKSIPRKVPRF